MAEIGRRGGVVMAVFFSRFVMAATSAAMIGLFDMWRELKLELAGDEAAIYEAMDHMSATLTSTLEMSAPSSTTSSTSPTSLGSMRSASARTSTA